MDFVSLNNMRNVPVHCKTQEDYMHLFAVDPNYRVISKPRKVQQNASVTIKAIDNTARCPKWIKGIVNYFRKHPVK